MVKYFLIIVILIFSSCTKVQNVDHDPHENITLQYTSANCKNIKESYNFIFYGMAVGVFRHDKCANVNDMLVITWLNENDDLQKTGAKFLALLYLESKNEVNQDEKLKLGFVKYDTDEKLNTNGAFFQIIHVPKQK